MEPDFYHIDTYAYDLPDELIAQYPLQERTESRLMVIDRKKQTINHLKFHQIIQLLNSGDELVFNDTRVLPSRLIGKKSTGAKVEIFLIEPLEGDIWKVLAKPGRRLHEGTQVDFSKNFSCKILETAPSGEKKVQFFYEGNFEELLLQFGQVPLPQYIKRDPNKTDAQRYQTVYAKHDGSAAAPTAGLHFSEDLLQEIRQKGVELTFLTLHVGLGTFKPVTVTDVRKHEMHAERCMISPEASECLNIRSSEKRQICVGTTTCRALESIADEKGNIVPGSFSTDIFIYPGYQFKYVKSLLTNFHLPRSTLLMLVCAFGGYDLIMEAYKEAVKHRYRFFSYGDAMLIL
ncbi:MAG: tRNA preQ1(34) S-adenosylmethionine ribosyltransferase-isomerase QueA [Chlamydiales bacterium]